MDRLQLQQFSQQISISPVEIIREEMEMVILNKLSQTQLSQKLIFKGGTALRLCYMSPRFSQDLDFNQNGKITEKEIKAVLDKLQKDYQEIEIKEIYDKRYTLFTLLLVKSALLKQKFTIKIEISKKNYHLKSTDYRLMVVKSPVSPYIPLIYTYDIKRILLEKEIALKTRSQPRDYFDIWWIGEQLKKKITIPKPDIHPSRFKGELNQLLPDFLKN